MSTRQISMFHQALLKKLLKNWERTKGVTPNWSASIETYPMVTSSEHDPKFTSCSQPHLWGNRGVMLVDFAVSGSILHFQSIPWFSHFQFANGNPSPFFIGENFEATYRGFILRIVTCCRKPSWKKDPISSSYPSHLQVAHCSTSCEWRMRPSRLSPGWHHGTSNSQQKIVGKIYMTPIFTGKPMVSSRFFLKKNHPNVIKDKNSHSEWLCDSQDL
jgi:hypothetical protein